MTFAPYQVSTCVFCKADLPHARHVSELEAARAGIVIRTERKPSTTTEDQRAA